MVANAGSAGSRARIYLIDWLKSHLAKVIGINTREVSYRELIQRQIFGDRKYYNQAFDLLRIGAYTAVFKIGTEKIDHYDTEELQINQLNYFRSDHTHCCLK